MEIVERNIADLIPAEYNPRKLSSDQRDQIAASLKRFGFVDPVIINTHDDRKNVIIGGHMRTRVAKEELGMETVPCVELSLTLEQERELNIRLNKNSGAWDFEALSNYFEVDELTDWGFELSDLDMELGEDEPDIEEDDFDGEPPEEPKTELGRIYQLGSHRLMCGDSTSEDDVKRLMGEEKAALVFTDPPYRYKKMGKATGDFEGNDTRYQERISDIIDFDPTSFLPVLPIVFDGNMNAYIFCNTDLVPDYCLWARENEYNFNILTWHKKQCLPFTANHHLADTEYLIYISKRAVFNCSLDVNYGKYFILDNEKSEDHPTIKPQEIITTEVIIGSNKGDIVFDFFGGSGSTLIACEQTKRQCRMMELDPKYCDVIVKRYCKLKDIDPETVFETGVAK